MPFPAGSCFSTCRTPARAFHNTHERTHAHVRGACIARFACRVSRAALSAANNACPDGARSSTVARFRCPPNNTASRSDWVASHWHWPRHRPPARARWVAVCVCVCTDDEKRRRMQEQQPRQKVFSSGAKSAAVDLSPRMCCEPRALFVHACTRTHVPHANNVCVCVCARARVRLCCFRGTGWILESSLTDSLTPHATEQTQNALTDRLTDLPTYLHVFVCLCVCVRLAVCPSVGLVNTHTHTR